MISLADHRRKTLVRGGSFGRYLPASKGTGYLVYRSNKGILFAVPFDPGTLELHGTPSPVLEDVAGGRFGTAQFDLARNGTLATGAANRPAEPCIGFPSTLDSRRTASTCCSSVARTVTMVSGSFGSGRTTATGG